MKIYNNQNHVNLFQTLEFKLTKASITRVFHWPKDMAAVFDLAKTRIGNKRDQVEDALRDRVDKFETKVSVQNIYSGIFIQFEMPHAWNNSNQTFSIC